MKRLILAMLFLLALTVGAWATPTGCADTDTVCVTVTVPTFMTVEYTGHDCSSPVTISPTESDLISGNAESATVSDTLKGWANVTGKNITSAIGTQTGGWQSAWGLEYTDGTTWYVVGTASHSVVLVSPGYKFSMNVTKWKVTGLLWSDTPGPAGATVTFTIS